MNKILFFFVALIAVIVAVLFIAPSVIPTAAYKPKIEAAASSALGRAVTISDDLTIKILPRTAFRVKDLSIANAEGFDGAPLARVAEADIGVKLSKLITNQTVEVDRFVLIEPKVNLARKADGTVNWNLAAPPQAPDGDAGAGSATGPARDITLGDVRIVDGEIRFADAAAQKTYALDDVDVAVVLTSLAEPLEIDGSLNFQGAPSTVDIVLTSLKDVMDGQEANLKMDLAIGDATAGADVALSSKDGLRYAGPVQLNAPDLPAFAALMGTEIADAPGFDRLSASGAIDGGDKSLRLSDAKIAFDKIDANGAITLDWSGAKPKAGGVLSTDTLDLRPYLPAPAETAEGFPAWSEAPLDFTSLRNIDANFDISANAILLSNLTIGESRLKLTINNGRMTADVPELSMYGGQGSGRLVVNARGRTPSIAGAIDLDAVSAQPLSLDLIKQDNLLGLGSLKFDFIASGASQAAIMRSIDGSGGFDLADGALKGVNIVKMARALAEFREGFNPAALQTAISTARGPDQQTDFSQFLSEFKITDGLVNTPVISLTGQFLTVKGSGTINLPNQTINLSLLPRATTSADGSGGRAVSVPVKVGGTFAQPTFGVDADALVRSGAESALRDLVGQIGRKDGADEEGGEEDPAAGLLRGILGGAADGGNDPQNSGEEANASTPSVEESLANEALNAIFGTRKDTSSDEEGDTPN